MAPRYRRRGGRYNREYLFPRIQETVDSLGICALQELRDILREDGFPSITTYTLREIILKGIEKGELRMQLFRYIKGDPISRRLARLLEDLCGVPTLSFGGRARGGKVAMRDILASENCAATLDRLIRDLKSNPSSPPCLESPLFLRKLMAIKNRRENYYRKRNLEN